MSRRDRFLRRGLPLLAGGVVTLLVAVTLLVTTTDAERVLPGVGPDCTVEADGRTVELTTAEAEAAATAAATTLREGGGLEQVSAALASDPAVSRAAWTARDADARLVAAALSGVSRGVLSCVHGGGADLESDTLDGRGLTPRAAAVRTDLTEAFGRQQLGGFARGGVRDGHMPGSAHYDGRAIDAFFRPINPANKTRGWAMAQYLVAHAERLDVETVIFDDQIWTARRAVQGWREYDVDTSDRPRRVARILEHRDHVHVDVAD